MSYREEMKPYIRNVVEFFLDPEPKESYTTKEMKELGVERTYPAKPVGKQGRYNLYSRRDVEYLILSPDPITWIVDCCLMENLPIPPQIFRYWLGETQVPVPQSNVNDPRPYVCRSDVWKGWDAPREYHHIPVRVEDYRENEEFWFCLKCHREIHPDELQSWQVA